MRVNRSAWFCNSIINMDKETIEHIKLYKLRQYNVKFEHDSPEISVYAKNHMEAAVLGMAYAIHMGAIAYNLKWVQCCETGTKFYDFEF